MPFGSFPKLTAPGSVPMVVAVFSGLLIDSETPGTVLTFASNRGYEADSGAPNNQVDPIRAAIPATKVGILYGTVPQGSPVASAITFTVYKNGVATALTCTVPAGSPAGTSAVDNNPAHAVAFADSNELDVRVSGVAPMAGNVPYSGSVSSTP
jgi:hypothetical protein